VPRKEVDILLAEYQAAHMNRDHYDSVRWTMGSIFIVGSLTLFGISFAEPVVGMPLQVGLLAVVSVILFGVISRF
jgi:hypothetical protein